jgi:hypothetical protein
MFGNDASTSTWVDISDTPAAVSETRTLHYHKQRPAAVVPFQGGCITPHSPTFGTRRQWPKAF